MQGIQSSVTKSLPEAESAVREALTAQGFGVLTEIDVAATLKEKLGVERSPLKILGACNPSLAHRALEIDPSVALMLPCNVVLEEESPGHTKVTIADPRELMPGERFADLAGDAAARLTEASRQVAGK